MPPFGSFQTPAGNLRQAAGNIRPGSGPRTRSIGGRTRASSSGPMVERGPALVGADERSRAKGAARTGDRRRMVTGGSDGGGTSGRG